jgi:alanyl-tRNA synthetase
MKSMRIIADHLRTAVMIMGDDRHVAPSNLDQGYIVRRMIRRAIRHGKLIGIQDNFCSIVAEEIIKIFSDVYPEVLRNRDFVLLEMANEESKFRNTIEQGIKEFEKLLEGFRIAFEKTGKRIEQISGKQAFKLFESYGFPLEMTSELAIENGLTVDLKGFEEAYKAHQDLSRAGAEQKFKGGLADTGEMSTKYHTATHLLHAALRKVLGTHVEQRGSNITADRLRFDFSHPEKLTEAEKQKVADLVNLAIQKDFAINCEEMSVAEAKNKGAIGIFEDKYGNRVKVYSVGDKDAEPSADSGSIAFSREICGGPHVERTGLLGRFRIKKEEAVSSGIRRIKAVLE